jgi:Beta/Gamma crystallin
MYRALPLLAAFASCLALSTGSQAADFRDAKGRFSFTVPDGWESEAPSNSDTITFVMGTGKGAKDDGAACLGMYLDMPATRSASQAELNTAVEGQLTKEFWSSALKSSGDQTFKVSSTGNRDKDGRRIHNVVFGGTSTENGKTVDGTGKMEVHFIPGSMHSVMCVTDTATYPTYSPAFEKIFASYEPSASAVIASLTTTPSSALTLFARASYQGQAQVLSADTPDLVAAGWVARAGSLAVDGADAWQVCDARGYAGNCQTISSAKDKTGLVVMSARRKTESFSTEAATASALRRGLAVIRSRR